MVASCAKDSASGSVKEDTIIRKENEFYDIYYTGDANRALAALREYVAYLSRYEDDASVRRVCYSGKAMALARIEVLRGYRGSHSMDLGPAIVAFRAFDESVPKLNDAEISRALLTIVAKDDKGRVPWAFPENKVPNHTPDRMPGSDAPGDSGGH
jgi:hypothetical protein